MRVAGKQKNKQKTNKQGISPLTTLLLSTKRIRWIYLSLGTSIHVENVSDIDVAHRTALQSRTKGVTKVENIPNLADGRPTFPFRFVFSFWAIQISSTKYNQKETLNVTPDLL